MGRSTEWGDYADDVASHRQILIARSVSFLRALVANERMPKSIKLREGVGTVMPSALMASPEGSHGAMCAEDGDDA